MPRMQVEISDVVHLKGTTAKKVLTRCANEVKRWKLPTDLSAEQRVACQRVLHDIGLCFTGYAATVASHMPAKGNEMLEKFVENESKF